MADWLYLVYILVGAAASAGGAWMAISVKLQWLRRDVDRAHKRLDEHRARLTDLERQTAPSGG